MDCKTHPMSIGTLLVEKNTIDFIPPYQRESAIWSIEKQQLFIDSLLNKIDIPKFYFHNIGEKSGRYKYAVIDGKQRLYTIFRFLDDELPLSDDFKLFIDKFDMGSAKGKIEPGSIYSKLSRDWQRLFEGRTLDIVVVSDAEVDDIEELFSRLNNGEPLTSAEKRNAMGGDMVALIRDIAKDKFFTNKVTFSNKRYAHLEAAAKIILIEKSIIDGKEIYCDLKKKFLDEMAMHNKTMTNSYKDNLQNRLTNRLKLLNRVFSNNDKLLDKQAYVPLYYIFIKNIEETYADKYLYTKLHEFFEDFYVSRIENLDKNEDDRDPNLVEFSRLMQQGTNDKLSIKSRVSILTRYFLMANQDIELKDKRRDFTDDERYALWIRSERKCQGCGRKLNDFNEVQADHRKQWILGGKTSLENARALCEYCNTSTPEKVK